MTMKKTIKLFALSAVICAVLVSFASCKGDYTDPNSGMGGSGTETGGSSGGGGKPAELSQSASYQDALAKCDEIIAYCNSHPTQQNTAVKNGVPAVKSSIELAGSSNWTFARQSTIADINRLINTLN
jgi:hypothetical protein